MIPKIIHYVWLGNNEKPGLVLKCIASWQKYLPDYEIMEWNDENTKHIDNQYMREAIEQKKWAFASDYIRLWALYHYGGIYLDTDVEIRKSLDEFLELKFFSGFEKHLGAAPITALMGSIINGDLVKELLQLYRDRRFVVDGYIDNTTNVVTITRYLCEKYKLGTDSKESELLILEDGVVIYPHYYFCTNNQEAYSIHHYNASWMSSWHKQIAIRLFGYKLYLYKRTWLERETLPDVMKHEDILYMKAMNIFVITRKSFMKKKRVLFCLAKCKKQ